MDDFTTRLLPLLGQDGLERLSSARVLVIGLGGVGSSCVEALARGGVGHLVLLDRDVVEASNINRQAIAFTSTIGQRKVDVMRAMVEQINPACQVETRFGFLAPDGVEGLLDEVGQVDYVIDCIDTISQKLALAQACEQRGVALVSSMGGANKVDPSHLRFCDIKKTHMCRVARTVRKECSKRGVRHLEVLYSDEQPVRPRAEAGSSHDGAQRLGTASWMPPIMGQMLAGHVICRLCGLDG